MGELYGLCAGLMVPTFLSSCTVLEISSCLLGSLYCFVLVIWCSSGRWMGSCFSRLLNITCTPIHLSLSLNSPTFVRGVRLHNMLIPGKYFFIQYWGIRHIIYLGWEILNSQLQPSLVYRGGLSPKPTNHSPASIKFSWVTIDNWNFFTCAHHFHYSLYMLLELQDPQFNTGPPVLPGGPSCRGSGTLLHKNSCTLTNSFSSSVSDIVAWVTWASFSFCWEIQNIPCSIFLLLFVQ